MRALEAAWFAHHRARMACWHPDRIDEVEREIAEMQAEICELKQELAQQRDTTPTTGTITATMEDGTVTDTYTPGATIYLTAGQFANTEGVALTGTIPGQWASDQGIIAANPNNADEATLVNVPLGDVNVTFTADSGLVLNYTATVADDTPVSGTITGSTTPPADEPAAS